MSDAGGRYVRWCRLWMRRHLGWRRRRESRSCWGEFGDGGGEIEQGVTIVVYDRGFVFTHFCVFVWRMTIRFRFLC